MVERPLVKISDSFRELASPLINSSEYEIPVAPFSEACSHVSILFGCLGFAFKFAEKDYVNKVRDLSEASKTHATLHLLLDNDIKNDSVRRGGSHTRNLLRVMRGLDMIKVLFEKMLMTDNKSLRENASAAYNEVFAPHHAWAIRKAVSAGMYSLPTNSQLLKKLNEQEETAKVQMQGYVEAADVVLKHINNLYLSRKLGTDW